MKLFNKVICANRPYSVEIFKLRDQPRRRKRFLADKAFVRQATFPSRDPVDPPTDRPIVRLMMLTYSHNID